MAAHMHRKRKQSWKSEKWQKRGVSNRQRRKMRVASASRRNNNNEESGKMGVKTGEKCDSM